MSDVSKSTHRVEVLQVQSVEPHPNADRLEIIPVWGYRCVVRKGEFSVGDMIAYVPPDSVVPDKEEYAFMWSGKNPSEKNRRIRSVRLRGVLSPGLVIPAPSNTTEGEDVADLLGITHWDPPPILDGLSQSQSVPGPHTPGSNTKYDLENGYRYHSIIPAGTLVQISEKLHGSNSRFTFWDGIMYAGLRTWWSAFDENKPNKQWLMIQKYPGIRKMCEANPGHILFGEVYGMVQSLRYGHTPENRYSFAAFDIFDEQNFMSIRDKTDCFQDYDIPSVPVIVNNEYSLEEINRRVDGPSLIDGANHAREGIVVTPFKESYNKEIGRVILKFVSSEFLEKDSLS